MKIKPKYKKISQKKPGNIVELIEKMKTRKRPSLISDNNPHKIKSKNWTELGESKADFKALENQESAKFDEILDVENQKIIV